MSSDSLTSLLNWLGRAPKQAQIEIDRYLVETYGLKMFLRLAWPVVEGGKEYVHGWHIDAIAEHLEALSSGESNNLLVNMPPRHMKLLADDTPVPTPDGMRRHGDLKVGDRVFGPDGSPANVIRISETSVADYEVGFSTGETIKCNGDHLWTVWDRWSQTWKTLTTSALHALPQEKGRNRFFIPDTAPLSFPERDLPLDPYFFGCWLGDGSATKPCITHDRNDREHIEKILSRGFTVSTTCSDSTVTYFSHQGLIGTFRAMGIYGNKHIPEIYLCASDAQRMELLAGLIDTDGSVEGKTGRIRYSTCDARLAADVERLAHSLGFRAHIVTAAAPGYGDYASDKTVYQVCFQIDRPIPTAIPRKRIFRLDFTRRRRAIVSIRVSDAPESGHCITVDREDGLYVAGRTHLVTHNSTLISVMYPVWDWLQNPWRQFLFSSYAQSLATRDAVKCRRIIQSPWFQERWGDRFMLTSDQNAKERYDNDRGGYRLTTSVDGQLTGEGGDIIVLDDPHNAREAGSVKKRQNVIDWWSGSMISRVNDPKRGRYALVMQRIHELDLSGYILETDRENWTHLCLPARYEPSHPFIYAKDPRTKDGELLWPDRFDEPSLKRLETNMGQYKAAGQLQQRPAPREGGLFQPDRIVVVDALPAGLRLARGWDFAATEEHESEDPDYTAAVKLGTDGEGRFYIAHADHFRGSPLKVEQTMVATASQDGKSVEISYPQDPGQAGKGQAQYLAGKLAGYKVSFSPETGSKEVRAQAFAAQVEAGNVFMLRGDWNKDLLDEMRVFPNGRHDDLIDAASRAFNKLVEKNTSGMLGFMQAQMKTAEANKPVIPAGIVATTFTGNGGGQPRG